MNCFADYRCIGTLRLRLRSRYHGDKQLYTICVRVFRLTYLCPVLVSPTNHLALRAVSKVAGTTIRYPFVLTKALGTSPFCLGSLGMLHKYSSLLPCCVWLFWLWSCSITGGLKRCIDWWSRLLSFWFSF